MAELQAARRRPPRSRRGRRRGLDEVRGGYREGAGRKTLYPGKTVRVTVSLTPEAIDRAREVAAQLQKAHPAFPISVSDAVEAALWEYPPRRRKK